MGRDNLIRGRVLALALMLLATTRAQANGNEIHTLTLDERGAGLSAAGLSGAGRESQPAVPVSSGAITVSGLPAGSTIERAYLYWIIYGASGSASIELDGANITGTAIGESAGTCWKLHPTFKNFAYRADVTAKVSGNGKYVLTGFPSGTATVDMQGASLFIVYSDPAEEASGRVILMDGAITVGEVSGGQKTTFPNVNVPSTVLSAKFLLGVGDGESNLTDGSLELNGDNVPLPSDGAHYRSSAGLYWDARTYDVKELLTPGSKTIEWEQNYAGDCLAFAFSALAFRASIVDADADDVDDSLDNCPGVKNPDQADPDHDGLGDLCDNCPERANKNQGDEDEDGTGNICDTCPQLANPDNLDTDADGWGDACDTCASVANPDQIRPEICPDVGSGGSGGTGSGAVPSGNAGEPSSQGGESNGNAGEAPGGSGKGGTKTSGGSSSNGARSSEGGAGDEDGFAEARDDGGCGCAIPGTNGGEAKLLALVAVVLASLRRRRALRRAA